MQELSTCAEAGLPWRSKGEDGREEPAEAPVAARKASSALEPLPSLGRSVSLNMSLLLALLPASCIVLVFKYWKAACLACTDHDQDYI